MLPPLCGREGGGEVRLLGLDWGGADGRAVGRAAGRGGGHAQSRKHTLMLLGRFCQAVGTRTVSITVAVQDVASNVTHWCWQESFVFTSRA